MDDDVLKRILKVKEQELERLRRDRPIASVREQAESAGYERVSKPSGSRYSFCV